LLEIPQKVGGRYSVFTAVGLFPLRLLGIDIAQLIKGAQDAIKVCTSEQVKQNPAAISALLKHTHYQQCVNINDMFVFSTRLFSTGLWYRQLMGESIGKEFDTTHQRVEVGITPTVSVGSTDLHSVGQLYLGGPRDKFTTFVTVQEYASDLTLPQMPEFEPFVAKIQGKKLSVIMNAILQGVQEAYATHQRPFCTVKLERIDAYSMGQLLQRYMIEMMYLGFLFDVNPFDQPNVESYKNVTRKILASS
jgi:glucose-6-phosphate isomerase